MQDWLNHIRPYTSRILINHSKRLITLVHPHFQPGLFTFRLFLHSIKSSNNYSGYTVQAIGYTSLKGICILQTIKRYLDKLDNIEYVRLQASLEEALYTLQVKFMEN